MPGAALPLEHEHVPPDDPVEGPDRAVVVLHGRGANERDLLPVAKRLDDDLHIISLRAPEPLMGGYTWYELDLPDGDIHRSQPDADDFRRSLDLVTESVDAAIDAYGLDPTNIGLLGFSQGAIVSFALIIEAPTDYAWTVGLHGYLPASHEGATPVDAAGRPVFVSAGSADQIIPPERARMAADRLEAMGFDVEFREYDTSHGIAHTELDDVVRWVGERRP